MNGGGRRRAAVLLLGVALLAAGCTTAPPRPTWNADSRPQEARQWEGRMGLQLDAFADQPARAEQFNFELSGHAERGEFKVMTPLGTQLAAVRWTAGMAWLDGPEGISRYPSVEALTEALLGEALPLDAILSWLDGRPDGQQPWQSLDVHDPGALPTPAAPRTFTQAGWTIDLSARAQGRLEARRAAQATQRGVRLKIKLDTPSMP